MHLKGMSLLVQFPLAFTLKSLSELSNHWLGAYTWAFKSSHRSPWCIKTSALPFDLLFLASFFPFSDSWHKRVPSLLCLQFLIHRDFLPSLSWSLLQITYKFVVLHKDSVVTTSLSLILKRLNERKVRQHLKQTPPNSDCRLETVYVRAIWCR